MTSYKTMLKEIELLEQQLKGGAGSGNFGHGGRPGKIGGSSGGKGGSLAPNLSAGGSGPGPNELVKGVPKITAKKAQGLTNKVSAELDKYAGWVPDSKGEMTRPSWKVELEKWDPNSSTVHIRATATVDNKPKVISMGIEPHRYNKRALENSVSDVRSLLQASPGRGWEKGKAYNTWDDIPDHQTY